MLSIPIPADRPRSIEATMRKSSPVLVLLITAILLLLGFVAYVWISVPSAPPVVLPNPNGFPQFLDIGRR